LKKTIIIIPEREYSDRLIPAIDLTIVLASKLWGRLQAYYYREQATRDKKLPGMFYTCIWNIPIIAIFPAVYLDNNNEDNLDKIIWSLNHEYFHYILHSEISLRCCLLWDNVCSTYKEEMEFNN